MWVDSQEGKIHIQYDGKRNCTEEVECHKKGDHVACLHRLFETVSLVPLSGKSWNSH